jgi:VanZ family protein
MRRAWLWVPPLVYMLAIFLLSSESQPLPALTGQVWDKLLHLAEYAALGLLFCRALRGEGCTWSAAIVLAALLATGYGASDEWHQSFVPLRDSNVRDWVADALGGMTGATLWASMASRRPRRPRR